MLIHTICKGQPECSSMRHSVAILGDKRERARIDREVQRATRAGSQRDALEPEELTQQWESPR